METLLTIPAIILNIDVDASLREEFRIPAIAAWTDIKTRLEDHLQNLTVFVGNVFDGVYYTGGGQADYVYLYEDGTEFIENYDSTKPIAAVGFKDKKDVLNDLLKATAFRVGALTVFTLGTMMTENGLIVNEANKNFKQMDNTDKRMLANMYNSLSDNLLDGVIKKLTDGRDYMQNRRGVLIKTYGIWKNLT